MSHITANRVSEFTMSSGTGSLVLSAARGFKRFNSEMSIGDTCWYSIEWFSPVTGEALAFEHGTATYALPDTLTRTQVKESSSGVGVLHAFPTGRKRVSMTILAPDAQTRKPWLDALGITEDVVVQPSAPVAQTIANLNAAAAAMRAQTAFLGAA